MEDYLISDFVEVACDKRSGSVALEDCIMRKDKPATAGSNMLEGFVSPYDAAVVERLNDANIPVIARTSMTEFGIDRISADKPEILSGAVKTVSTGAAEYALCNDVFGRIRRQAPANDVCYIHPTYGSVSRYGLIPSAASMDQIGVVCQDIENGFKLLTIIAGNDRRDGAMYPETAYRYTPAKGRLRLAVPGNVWDSCEYANEIIPQLQNRFEIVESELKYFNLYKQVMYILSSAELSNNIHRYDGIKFGYRAKDFAGVNDLYIKTRSEGFDREVKLASMVSAIVLSHDNYTPFYEKAMKLRRLIRDAAHFGDYDVIALPTVSGGSPYQQSALYALAVLSGFPSISIPFGNHGIQLVAAAKQENLLFGAWEVLNRGI